MLQITFEDDREGLGESSFVLLGPSIARRLSFLVGLPTIFELLLLLQSLSISPIATITYSMRVKKLQSDKCAECFGNCSECPRCRRL